MCKSVCQEQLISNKFLTNCIIPLEMFMELPMCVRHCINSGLYGLEKIGP